MVNFNRSGAIVAARILVEEHQNDSLKAVSDGVRRLADADNATQDSPAALEQKLAEMAGDMASVATQFRSRWEFDRARAASIKGFECVLEEDVVLKAQRLMQMLETKNKSIEMLLARARSLFPDDSDLMLVLQELLKRTGLAKSKRHLLQRMIDDVAHNSDPKILRAGINCALKARLFGAALGLKASYLRQSYRRFICSGGCALQDYEEWISSYGYKVRHLVLDFIEESLGTDIRAQDPSCCHSEFGDLVGRMFHLHLLRSADCEFVKGLLTRRLMPPREQEEAEWLLLLCSLLGQQVPFEKLLQQSLDACLLPTHAARSAWLYAVRCACMRLPPELFERSVPEDESVVQMLQAFDRLVDHYSAAELLERRGISP